MARFLAWAFTALFAASVMGAPSGPQGIAGLRLPGKFVWLDLATENPSSAREFYGAVFGWKFHDVPNAPASYAVATNEVEPVAGLFLHARPAGAATGARWLPLISVTDVQAAARIVSERGGKVLVDPRVVSGRGTHAVFRDPDGAVFGVLATRDGDPPDTPVEEDDVFWFDLFAPDPARAAAFYAAVAGYDVNVGEVAGRERTLLSSQDIARAGIARPRASSDRPSWLAYILVDDVPAALDRVRKAGGKVVLPPRADLLDGNLAVIADREGGVIGIVRWVNESGARGAPR
jgi:predicted enzyme related to lactoylglutathione lyase